MSVWVEKPDDGGSAVWGCSACDHGAWCSDHTLAQMEAQLHATGHGEHVSTINRAHGPKPSNDSMIRRMHERGMSTRAIAAAVGLTHAGVVKALRRIKADR